MQGIHLRKYGVEAKIPFVLYEVDGVDLRVDASDGGTDCALTKDEGAETTCDNDFVDEGSGYSITLTATEMEAARITVYVIDSATKVWLDEAIIIETYGNASAQHAMDFDDGNGTTLTEAGGTGDQLTAINLPNQTMDITGTITGNLDGNVTGSVATCAAATVSAIGANVITAASIAAAAIDNATFAADVGSTAYATNIIALACRKVLDELNLDHLLKVDTTVAADADLEAYVVAGTVMAHLMGIGADVSTFNATEDSVEALGTLAAAIKVVTDALTAAAATKLALSAGTIVTGTVSHDNTAASTTVFYSDDITEATADHYKGRIVIFTSGDLQYQATDITAYALDTGEGKFTVTALTEAPADNVTFIII